MEASLRFRCDPLEGPSRSENLRLNEAIESAKL
jgi:hypothetical protein